MAGDSGEQRHPDDSSGACCSPPTSRNGPECAAAVDNERCPVSDCCLPRVDLRIRTGDGAVEDCSDAETAAGPGAGEVPGECRAISFCDGWNTASASTDADASNPGSPNPDGDCPVANCNDGPVPGCCCFACCRGCGKPGHVRCGADALCRHAPSDAPAAAGSSAADAGASLASSAAVAATAEPADAAAAEPATAESTAAVSAAATATVPAIAAKSAAAATAAAPSASAATADAATAYADATAAAASAATTASTAGPTTDTAAADARSASAPRFSRCPVTSQCAGFRFAGAWNPSRWTSCRCPVTSCPVTGFQWRCEPAQAQGGRVRCVFPVATAEAVGSEAPPFQGRVPPAALPAAESRRMGRACSRLCVPETLSQPPSAAGV